MSKAEITITGLAKQTGQQIEAVMQIAKAVLNRDVSPEYRITPNQGARIREELSYLDSKSLAESTLSPSETTLFSSQPKSCTTSTLKNDMLTDLASMEFTDLSFRVFCHQDVYEGLNTWRDLRKKTTMAIKQIIALGHTSVVKGCSDPQNRGWLRSPLGGGSGNHYYLWWARSGSPALMGTNSEQGDIVIRAIRHHDEHSVLNAGNLSTDYLEIDRKDLTGGKEQFELPWNDEQNMFIKSEEPIRLAIGKPGSGKTTVLWQSVDLRSNQTVLYATWSKKLVDEAKKHFLAFAPKDTKVLTYDFLELLGSFSGFDVERLPLIKAFRDFKNLLPKGARASALGPWQSKEYALFSEIRAHFIGASVEYEKEDLTLSTKVPWNKSIYLAEAGERLSPSAAESVLRVVEEIEPRRPIFSFFPELQASWTAIQRLRSGEFPPNFDLINRIVVDEVQDLTLLEQLVFVELHKSIGKASGIAPFLLVAGDEGQTVRPSGFKWASTARQISERIKDPQKITLQESVRYPERISQILENASKLYGNITKESRPRKQSQVSSNDCRQADVFHVSINDKEGGRNVIQQLLEIDDLVVISALDEVDNDEFDQLPAGVLTPNQSKGLEYQTVCVVNPGRALQTIGQPLKGSDGKLETLQRRTYIDQLRVAMSRSTESLVFIDIEATETAVQESRKLLDHPTPFEATDLITYFKEPNRSPEERVLSRISDSQTLIESNPARAWQLVLQALDIVGESGLHNGVTDPGVRKDAFEVSTAIAARLLSEGLPQKLNKLDVCEVAKDSLKRIGNNEDMTAFVEFSQWVDKPDSSPFRFLRAIKANTLESQWLSAGLSSKVQQLLKSVQDGSKDIANAVYFDGEVELWLKACKFSGDEKSEALSLRRAAVDALIENRNANNADNILKTISPSDDLSDQLRLGKIRLLQSRWAEAAEALESGRDFELAIKCWREAGSWEDAQRISLDINHPNEELTWLCNLAALLKAKPAKLAAALTEKERRRLGEIRSSI